jgi:PhnB protein
MLMRFKDSPEPHQGGMPPGSENKVMHATLTVAGSTVLVSDGNCMGKPEFKGISLSLTVPNEAEAERVFALLSEGGKIQLPLTRTFFSPRFGMCTDKFGVAWMLHVAA